MGLIDDARWNAFCRKRDAVAREMERLKSTWVHPGWCRPPMRSACSARPWSTSTTWPICCAGPASSSTGWPSWRKSPPELAVSRETLRAELGESLADAVIEQVQIGIKYAGYIDKAERGSRARRRLREPQAAGRARLRAGQRPLLRGAPEAGAPPAGTLGQASRISGVTPAAISLLLIHLRRAAWGFAANTESVSDAA